jgi:Protein of unknwon function (DUF3310)
VSDNRGREEKMAHRYTRRDLKRKTESPAQAMDVRQIDIGHLFKDERREQVNHPRHYGGDTEHEVVKCLEAWGLESDALLWNAVKYIARAGKKGGAGAAIEDLRKAAWYLGRRIGKLESKR